MDVKADVYDNRDMEDILLANASNTRFELQENGDNILLEMFVRYANLMVLFAFQNTEVRLAHLSDPRRLHTAMNIP